MRKNTNFLCPSNVSDDWIERFKILEFILDTDGYLYSLKMWNDNWDNQTKSLWLRSIGMSPDKIAKKLNVRLTTVKNRWISNITLHYELKGVRFDDYATIGFTDNYLKHHVNYGGVPQMPDPQLEMDGELNQVRHDYHDDSDEIEPTRDIYKEYYGDYKD